MCNDVEECWSGEEKEGQCSMTKVNNGAEKKVNMTRCRRVLERGGERWLVPHDVGGCWGEERKGGQCAMTKVNDGVGKKVNAPRCRRLL